MIHDGMFYEVEEGPVGSSISSRTDELSNDVEQIKHDIETMKNEYVLHTDFYRFKNYIESDRYIYNKIFRFAYLFDWKTIVTTYVLPEDFIMYVIDGIGSNINMTKLIPWTSLFICQNLPMIFISKFKHLFNWEYLIENSHCSTEVLDYVNSILNKERWDLVSKYVEMDFKFLLKFKDRINWSILIEEGKTILTEEEIEKFYSYIPLSSLLYSDYIHRISEDFVKKHINEFNYSNMTQILTFVDLSVDFLIKYADYYSIDRYMSLSQYKKDLPISLVDYHLSSEVVEHKDYALMSCMNTDNDEHKILTDDYISLIVKHIDKLEWKDIPELVKREGGFSFWLFFIKKKYFG